MREGTIPILRVGDAAGSSESTPTISQSPVRCPVTVKPC
jgi:hypothetical protein